ncbi:MAG: hypothetical protein M3211_13105 [Actinomycetota bacterium]|nr:hypothetical protein [Actinomycetota bacterium]
MANSDNVLRGGLTPKHVDVPELQRVLDHSAGPTAVVIGTATGEDEVAYRTAVPNFELSRLDVGVGHRVEPPSPCPQVLFCVAGAVSLFHDDVSIELEPDESAFVPAAAGAVDLAGGGVVFRAAVPPEALSG